MHTRSDSRISVWSSFYYRCHVFDPHSLHLLRSRPCSQICDPPHSLHSERRRPCSQIDAPPHSLHVERRRPCSQIDAPPHSLHLERTRPCGHAPHTLQFERFFTPCSHGPFVRGALFRFAPFPSRSVFFSSSPFIPSSSAGGSTLTSGTSSSGTSSSTGLTCLTNGCGRHIVVMSWRRRYNCAGEQ